MEKVEEARLSRLKDQGGREAGLIIPIILRGQESLPAIIRSQRHWYTFERFALSTREIARNPQFEDRVREIASVIYARKSTLAPLADELTCDCHSFAFPTEEYKGGTGRTMALANVGCALARDAKLLRPVLLVDWDLEAPGLHRYLRKQVVTAFGGDESLFDNTPGLIDLFIELRNRIWVQSDLPKPERDFDAVTALLN